VGEVTSLRAFVLTFSSGGRGHGGLFFGVQQVSLPVQLSSISVFCVCVGVGAGVVRFLCFISAKKMGASSLPRTWELDSGRRALCRRRRNDALAVSTGVDADGLSAT